MTLPLTPPQTIGPFFHRALLDDALHDLTAKETIGQRIVIEGLVLDGDGNPVGDAMLEIWQANAAGRYDHPDDPERQPIDTHFHGFGRCATDRAGCFRFVTIKPGPVRETGDFAHAPHINVNVFARGLLHHLVTRIYFPGEALNATDPVLTCVPESRRATLVARDSRSSTQSHYRFDIILQGENETVFFEV
ncbi:MAG TPA: protocatechuate 3,4-dioxygenase subunit alpha [Candidatus Binataceae bacterium]|nr:protocatechuate 3,4-dioxygenase subunit alpha [Candidatus Binataceae bacterium]